MEAIKKNILQIVLSAVWISISEFLRNEYILKHYWIDHYERLGIIFPSEPINGAVWGIWSLLFAVAIFTIFKKFSFLQTVFLSWFVGFVLMWLVIGNMGVLPERILYFAVPLSLLETFVAVFIIKYFDKDK